MSIFLFILEYFIAPLIICIFGKIFEIFFVQFVENNKKNLFVLDI